MLEKGHRGQFPGPKPVDLGTIEFQSAETSSMRTADRRNFYLSVVPDAIAVLDILDTLSRSDEHGETEVLRFDDRSSWMGYDDRRIMKIFADMTAAAIIDVGYARQTPVTVQGMGNDMGVSRPLYPALLLESGALREGQREIMNKWVDFISPPVRSKPGPSVLRPLRRRMKEPQSEPYRERPPSGDVTYVLRYETTANYYARGEETVDGHYFTYVPPITNNPSAHPES